MPKFYDPKNLTEVQQSRWAAAVTEYDRIQTANVDRQLESMNEA